MIGSDFGDVVLVAFPFTDQSASKRRPAVVVSSPTHNTGYPDVILIAITSRSGATGESVVDWKKAGLLKPSAFRPIIMTVQKRSILKKLGRLAEEDRRRLGELLREWLGEN